MTDHYKMVRDNHQSLFKGKISGRWRTSPDPVSALTRKLAEEYGEYAEHRDPGELMDMLDVIGELLHLLDPGWAVHDVHVAKRVRNGVFRAHLEWSPS
jgi:predicted house-cleaning noncanonical NTP pyrophosphatase (MazG superfamily)